MHVALTGASGFIGSVIARHLHDAGHTVTALVRPTSRRDHIEPFVTRFAVGEQDDRDAWSALLAGADCVIHNSADFSLVKPGADLSAHLRSNLVGSIELLHRSDPLPFIFMSSVAVHHDIRPRWNGVIDEDHPTRPASRYGAYKAAVEAHLWAAHFASGRPTSALRPCAVYGIDPNLPRSIGYPIVEAVRDTRRYARPGGGKFVHVDDVAAAAVAIAANPSAAGRVYDLADCYARWADWASITAELLGIDADIDTSSPPHPRNTFAKTAAHDLGVGLDRGHDGIRRYLQELIAIMS